MTTTCKMACDTCCHKKSETVETDGSRMVNCEINKYQMYAPMVYECKHHQLTSGTR